MGLQATVAAPERARGQTGRSASASPPPGISLSEDFYLLGTTLRRAENQRSGGPKISGAAGRKSAERRAENQRSGGPKISGLRRGNEQLDNKKAADPGKGSAASRAG